MAYVLEALIAPAAVLSTVVADLPGAVLVPLPQGMAMIPMTFDAPDDDTDAEFGFSTLPAGFGQALAVWSAKGPIGYLEAEFFAGDGTQRAALWADGRLAFGPVMIDEGERFPAAGSPISRLLREFGVTSEGHVDEFAALGLGRFRATDDWLAVAAAPPPE